MDDFCPRCGTMFGLEIALEAPRRKALCVGCGLALSDPPRPLPRSEVDGDQIAYDLAEWPPEDRSIATSQLIELGIPYRWEDYCVLVVPEAAERQVDALLDEIDESAAAGGPPGDGALVEEDGRTDGGEEAVSAMGDLFVAADTLQRGVYDEGKVLAFLEAADAVVSSLPPYGIEAPLWERAQEEADTIVAALAASTDGDDDETIIDAARALRDLLRPYV